MHTYIITVSTNKIRRAHIINQLSSNPCLKDHTFIDEGDLDTISSEVHKKYFGGRLLNLSGVVSCAYKHILAYEDILKNTGEIAIILKDDIFLEKNFCESVKKINLEIDKSRLTNIIASLEDSNLKYIERSRRIKGNFLYKESSGRMTGAYMIDKVAAKSIINEIEKNKCHLPIDLFHNYCSGKGIIEIYWAQPSVATQGSLNGKLESMLDARKFNPFRNIGFSISRIYKKILYWVR
jgi:glycosyl transferase family 25